jgi:hypothetical protein
MERPSWQGGRRAADFWRRPQGPAPQDQVQSDDSAGGWPSFAWCILHCYPLRRKRAPVSGGHHEGNLAMKRLSVFLVAAACIGAMLQISAQPQSATEFFKAFWATYAKAKSFQDVASFYAKDVVDAVAQTAPDQNKAMWDEAKKSEPKDVKVVKETATATGATLELSGVGADRQPLTGTAQLVKERGAWKLLAAFWMR